jgi:HEPN domain-containing protein
MSSRVSSGKSDSRRYYEWLDFALDDIRCARYLFGFGGYEKAVAFHCQQAIEKALKGYILFKRRRHIDGHNLTYLCRQAIKEDQSFSDYLDESARLNRYYIGTRYPSDYPIKLSESEILNVLHMANAMFKHISKLIYENKIAEKSSAEGQKPLNNS